MKKLGQSTHGARTRWDKAYRVSLWSVKEGAVRNLSRNFTVNHRFRKSVQVHAVSFLQLRERSGRLVSARLPVLSSLVRWRELYKRMWPHKGPLWQVLQWCHLVPWRQRQPGDLHPFARQLDSGWKWRSEGGGVTLAAEHCWVWGCRSQRHWMLSQLIVTNQMILQTT